MAKENQPNKEEMKKENKEEKTEGKKIEEKKKVIEKKTEATIFGKSIPISTKHSISICRFIKGKKIEDCIIYLEEVIKQKKAIPMKGEIPHRRGKMMSGRFPKKASQYFIKLLKNLNSNAGINGLENPIIKEATATFASRPYATHGRRKKRTNIRIIAKSSELKKKQK